MTHGHLTPLDEAECRHLLASTTAGRLAWSEDGQVLILPVAHAVHGQDLLVRTEPGTPLAALRPGVAVAFEVDDLDADTRTGWDVVVRGTVSRTRTCSTAEEAVEAGAPERVWAPGDRRHVITITMTSLSGRAVSSDEPGPTPRGPAGKEDDHVR